MRMPLSELIIATLFVGAASTMLGLEVLVLAHAVVDQIRHRPNWGRLRTRRAIVLHTLAAFGVACILYADFIEPLWLEVTHHTVATAKLHATTLRIVQISDLHCGRHELAERRLVEKVNALDADVIVFTGDALNSVGGLTRFHETLAAMHAGLAKLAVRGNWDVHYFRGLDLFGGTGFMDIDGRMATVRKGGETIRFLGVPPDEVIGADEATAPLTGDGFTVLLYHYPALADSLAGRGVDLYLCGHTHGGQLRLPFYGALVTLSRKGKRYEVGRYDVGKMFVYVNRGVGVEGGAPRIRFLCRPEIAVFDIVPARGQR